MKKVSLIAALPLLGIVAYGLLYLHAYRNKDLDKISGYSAIPALPGDHRSHDASLLSKLLKPAAVYHQRRLARECAEVLDGVWLLEDTDKFGPLVPKSLIFRYTSENRISISPSIFSEGEQIDKFTVTRWIRPDYPTAIHTETTVDIKMFTDDEIGVLTHEMDPFGLGAKYKRQK